MKRRTRLKDIANALNVSITTVSRALNNKDDISPAMRKSVLEVAQMLNYRPNHMAVSLRKKSAHDLIGVILPSVDHYFYSTILKGITSASAEVNHLIMIGESHQKADMEQKLIQQFIEHYVCGIIYAPSRDSGSAQNVRTLEKSGIPFILIDRSFHSHANSFVQYDDFQGGFTACEHLILQGCRRIGHIRGDHTCSVSEDRYKGYREALSVHNIPFDPDLVAYTLDASIVEGYHAAKSLYAKNKDMDAIMTVTDNVAIGVYNFCQENNIKIPEDLAVVGYSNSLLSQHVTPRLTTIEQNGTELGKTAFRLLTEQIKSPQKVFQKTFTSSLIIRESSLYKQPH